MFLHSPDARGDERGDEEEKPAEGVPAEDNPVPNGRGHEADDSAPAPTATAIAAPAEGAGK